MNTITHNYLDCLIGVYVPKKVLSQQDIKEKRKQLVNKSSSLAIFESEIISTLKISKRLFEESNKKEVKPSDIVSHQWFKEEKLEDKKDVKEEVITSKSQYMAEVYKQEL